MARTRSNRFGSVGVGEDFVTFRLQTKDFVHLVDRISHKFLGGGFQSALSVANEKAAIQMQQAIAEALDEKIKGHRTRNRPRRPGERLKMSILDANNREVLANTFRVGIPAWYDRSPAALYWRGVEEEGIGAYTTYGFFVGPGVVGPHAPPTGQQSLIQLSRGKMGNGRKPPVIHVGAFNAYHFHRVGVANSVQRLDMAGKYLRELARIGLTMQLRADAFSKRASGFVED